MKKATISLMDVSKCDDDSGSMLIKVNFGEQKPGPYRAFLRSFTRPHPFLLPGLCEPPGKAAPCGFF